MQKTKFLLASIGLLLCLSLHADISFRDYSFDKAKDVAKFEKRNIIVSFSANWCLPCKLLEEGAFQDARLTQFMNHEFVNIEALYDDKSDREWFEEYQIVDFPSILILDKDGNEIQRIHGLMTAEILFNTFQQYQQGAIPLEPTDFQKEYKEKYNIKTFADFKNGQEDITSESDGMMEPSQEDASMILQFARFKSKRAAKKKRRKLKKKDIKTIVLEEKVNGENSYVVILDKPLNYDQANHLFKTYSSDGIECFTMFKKQIE